MATAPYMVPSRILTTTSQFVRANSGWLLHHAYTMDPVIEMHQYLDSDGSGTSPVCVSPTIGAERLQAATAWLEANNLKGFLGEIGAGSNPDCIAAVKGALCTLQSSRVWLGALWWAAGPWWGNVGSTFLLSLSRFLTDITLQYFQSIEPPNGAAIPSMLPQALEPFL